MKCADCQKGLLERAGDPLSEEVATHLLGCASCRQAHARAVTVRQLLGLKRFEQPAPHFEVRNLARVRAAIADVTPASAGWFSRWLDVLSGPSSPVLRYAAAGVVLGLIGINWLSVRSLPPLPHASIEALRAAQPASSTYASAPADAPPPGLGPVQTPLVVGYSNQQPWMLEGSGGPHYGTGSRLAGFDY